MCDILERIKEFIDYKGIAIASFEKRVGMSNASFSKQLKKGGAIGTDKLENILLSFPDLSPLWLLTGKGKMLRFEEEEDFDEQRNYQSIDRQIETRPRIPFDAVAGSLSAAVSSVSKYDCELVPVIPTFPRYDFTIVTRGDSMLPDFHSGDELACTFVKESSFIQWGRTHVLDTTQGVVLKKIFDRKHNILCRSINSDYPDFEVPKDEIYHIAIVVGLIRHF